MPRTPLNPAEWEYHGPDLPNSIIACSSCGVCDDGPGNCQLYSCDGLDESFRGPDYQVLCIDCGTGMGLVEPVTAKIEEVL